MRKKLKIFLALFLLGKGVARGTILEKAGAVKIVANPVVVGMPVADLP